MPAKKSTQATGARLVRIVRDRTRDFVLREIVARVEKKPDLQPADLSLALTARIQEGVPAGVLERRGVETAKQLERKVEEERRRGWGAGPPRSSPSARRGASRR